MSKVKTNAIIAGDPLPDDQTSTAPAAPAAASPEVKPAVVPPALTPEPNRPGLETQPAAAAPEAKNPFIRLAKWNRDARVESLSAMEVPGGCLIKSSFAWPGYMGESICFVPDVRIKDGNLVGDAMP